MVPRAAPRVPSGTVTEVLIATDSEAIRDELAAVIEGPGTKVRWVRSGHEVRPAIDLEPTDLVVLDNQIGAMGGIAVALELRLEIDARRLEGTKVLLVLDRRPDVFLARRSGVEGWLLKPLDPIRTRRAVRAVLRGETWHDESYQPTPVAVPFGTQSVD